MAPGVSSKEVPKSIIRQALSMSLGTFSSRILGLIRDMALAALFSRGITDAWTAAFRLPNLFRRLFGEGSLSVSFIPVFVEARMESPERAQNLANGFYTLLLVFLAILTALGILLADPVMRLLLDADYGPEKLAVTVRMARIMFGFVFFITTYAYFMGILNALGKFALPAMAPTLFNISMIVSTLIPGSMFPFEGDGLAWGVLIGGALQMGVLIPGLRRLGALPHFQWAGMSADIRKVLRNMVPGLLGMGLLQFVTIVNLKYASGMGDGAISYIYWADRLLELPLSLVSVSLGTALLPTLAGLWSQGQRERMSETVNYYLRLNLFIAIPAALGLFFLARPIVEVLFMRGQFNTADAEATATVLRVYAWLLVATSGVRVLVPAYYAIQNTWLPAVAAGGSLLLHIILAPILMKSWGLEGLVISSFVSAAVNMLGLLGAYSKYIGDFDFGKLIQQVFKFTLAGVVMAIVLQLHPLLQAQVGEAVVAKIIVLALMIALGAATYGGMSFVLKLEELQALKKIRK
jgi:putative peptidoglycan lipid II flippase